MDETYEDFDHSQATIIFVLGLLGLVSGCTILSPIALVMGNSYRRACQMEGVEPEGLGVAGWIMGIVGTVFLLLTIGILVLYFGVFFCIFGAALSA